MAHKNGSDREESTSKKHAALRRLAADAKKNIFEMLKLADEILSDKEYVESAGGEPELKQQLQANEFAIFANLVTLDAMLRAYRANPKIATWKENNFNLRVMIDLATPERESAGPRTDWKKRCAELEEQVAVLEAQLKETREANGELRVRIEEQANTIGEMRGQLKMLGNRQLLGVG